MEVSALRYSGGIGVHGRSPLLRLQSDERLISLTRRGSQSAFEVLVGRYQSRLLAFCRHLLGSREDAEDILQEVFAAAFNAILADDRPINVRPWLYRIARNRSLNHLRRVQPVGVDSMDIHLSDNGASTADKVDEREHFRLLLGDIQQLPETQRTALILREMDALSYEQIAEAMDSTIPSVKSLLVRARISLAEAAEARQLSCAEVRVQLAEVAEGLQRRPGPLVRRHLRNCRRCSSFQTQLKHTNKALAALLPVSSLVVVKKLLLTHLGGSAQAGSGGAGASAASGGAASSGAGAATGATAAGSASAATGGATAASGAAATSTAAAGGAVGATAAASSAGGVLSAGAGAIATKAAAGLAAAIVTVGAVAASHSGHHRRHRVHVSSGGASVLAASGSGGYSLHRSPALHKAQKAALRGAVHGAKSTSTTRTATSTTSTKTASKAKSTTTGTTTTAASTMSTTTASSTTTAPGRIQTQTDPTVLPPPVTTSGTTTTSSGSGGAPNGQGGGGPTDAGAYSSSDPQDAGASDSGSGPGS